MWVKQLTGDLVTVFKLTLSTWHRFMIFAIDWELMGAIK